ncbi:MAG: AraC family transcriptional regulator [Clostridiales bacterium]|jgi:AraC-like DNA-binding protein|nr:AraC family transcriptional regulator [Clostridiales bacterium]
METVQSVPESTAFAIHEANKTVVRSDWNWSETVSVYPYNRVYLVTDGSAELTLKSKTVRLEAGYLYFLPAYQVVTSRCNDFLEHYYIHFNTAARDAASDLLNAYEFNTRVKADETVEHYFRIATDNRFPKNVAEHLRLDAALRLLLSFLIIPESHKTLQKQRFAEVIRYIAENLSGDLSVGKLAAMANFNRSYFSVLFRQTFGLSPKAYILNQKLRRAQILLAETELSVTEISDALAFESNTYFSRLFKKKNLLSPLAYRKRFRGL